MGGDTSPAPGKLPEAFVMLMPATNESKNFIFRFNLVNCPQSNFFKSPADLFKENLLRFIGFVNKKKKLNDLP